MCDLHHASVPTKSSPARVWAVGRASLPASLYQGPAPCRGLWSCPPKSHVRALVPQWLSTPPSGPLWLRLGWVRPRLRSLDPRTLALPCTVPHGSSSCLPGAMRVKEITHSRNEAQGHPQFQWRLFLTGLRASDFAVGLPKERPSGGDEGWMLQGRGEMGITFCLLSRKGPAPVQGVAFLGGSYCFGGG